MADPTIGAVRDALGGLAALPDWLSVARQADPLRAAFESRLAKPGDLQAPVIDVVSSGVRAKGGRWLVRYELALNHGGSTAPSSLVVVGELLPPGVTAAEDDSPVPFGEAGWRGLLPELRLRLAIEPGDGGLPALAQLLDPKRSRALLRRSLAGTEYRGARVQGSEPKVARYHPGGRCTVIYRMTYAGAADGLPDPIVLKIYRGDKGSSAYQVMSALWATSLRSGDVVTLAEPLAYLANLRVLAQGPVAEERTLKTSAREAFASGTGSAIAQLRTELARTADGLAALHGSGALETPRLHWSDRVAEVGELAARLARTIPAVGAAASPLLARLVALGKRTRADKLVSSHGTFRPAQVLLSGDRIGFIDFDGSCLAEPAFDIGRFRACLRDTCVSAPGADGASPEGAVLEERMGLLDELCQEFLDRYRQTAQVNPERVLLWEESELFTLVLHAWSKVRPNWVRSRLALLDHHLRRLQA